MFGFGVNVTSLKRAGKITQMVEGSAGEFFTNRRVRIPRGAMQDQHTNRHTLAGNVSKDYQDGIWRVAVSNVDPVPFRERRMEFLYRAAEGQAVSPDTLAAAGVLHYVQAKKACAEAARSGMSANLQITDLPAVVNAAGDVVATCVTALPWPPTR